MHMQPTSRVSVVIPSYNIRGVVARSIDSALSQSLQPSEIIVVDDASSDGTVEELRARYAREDRLKIIELDENRGPAHARNTAIEAARGDWIAILDGDDAWEPLRLERLMGVAADGCDAVFDNLLGYDAALDAETGALFPRMRAGSLTVEDLLAPAQPDSRLDYGYLKPVMRRAFMEEHAIRYDTTLRTGEDRLLYLELLLQGARARLVPEPLYRYTLPVGQISGRVSGSSKSLPRDREVVAALRTMERRHPDMNESARQAVVRCINHIETQRPLSEFYAHRANGRIPAMLLTAVREPAVLKDICSKIASRVTARMRVAR